MIDKTVDILARTIWGEARGEGPDGMAAVACVVMNRLAVAAADSQPYWWGATVVQICQKPFQFSCWNADDPNRDKLLAVTDADPQFRQALDIATTAVTGGLPDSTNEATHYVVAGVNPAWLREEPPPLRTARIGKHVFYQLVPVPARVQPQPQTEKETANV